MNQTITTTHANPQTLPVHAGKYVRRDAVCSYCFKSLGLPASTRQRVAMVARHICKEKLMARQPSVGVPFS